ncbi:MAG: bifunctional glutamine-synthetase adenylyltransferase/deadenyltransferase, partial [Nocardioides sp.]
MTRPSGITSKGSLIRLGFLDTELAGARLTALAGQADVLAPLLGRTADPDQALGLLVDLIAAADAAQAGSGELLLETLGDDEGTAMRLLSVLGASSALGDHLLRHPDQWRELTDPDLGATRPTAAAMRAGLL